MRMTPIARVSSTLKNAGRNSQRVIHHGMIPATKNGATTKKIAEPKIALVFRMTGSHPIALLAVPTPYRSLNLRKFSSQQTQFWQAHRQLTVAVHSRTRAAEA